MADTHAPIFALCSPKDNYNFGPNV